MRRVVAVAVGGSERGGGRFKGSTTMGTQIWRWRWRRWRCGWWRRESSAVDERAARAGWLGV